MQHGDRQVGGDGQKAVKRTSVVTQPDEIADDDEDVTDDEDFGVEPAESELSGITKAPMPLKSPRTPPRRRISIYLPAALALKLQHRCLDAQVTLSEAIQQAVERAMEPKDQQRR